MAGWLGYSQKATESSDSHLNGTCRTVTHTSTDVTRRSTVGCCQEVLSTFEELSDWRLRLLPTDVHSLHNALIMRVCCHNRKHCWPLLVDPDGQAQLWVEALQDSDNIIRDDDISESLAPSIHHLQSLS